MNRNKLMKISFRGKLGLIFFGIILAIIILEIALRLGGFIIISLQEYKNRLSLKQKGAYRIMCLGESTTMGQYPPFLEEILNQRSKGIKFSVIDNGVRGIYTKNILLELESNLNIYKPDMVVAMMGINDQGIYVPYDRGASSKIKLFFRSFRVYKLLKLLGLHITAKKELFQAYKEQNRSIEAECNLKRELASNPMKELAYVQLGWVYIGNSRFIEAAQAFKKAVALNPKNDEAYAGGGWAYANQRRFIEAEQFFKKAVALNPKNDWAYRELGWAYIEQGKLTEAEQAFKKSVELDPNQDRAYAGLETIYLNKGNNKLFKECLEKGSRLLRRGYGIVTINNYRKLKQILGKRNLRFVCVQYPLRSVEPLKKIFEGQTGVIFVDNEKVFRDAVESKGYGAYFKDMFAGDFGHCTDKGNRLLAENIANEILKVVFKK